MQYEAIPKSAARVLNAQAIRDGWNLKKRKLDGDGRDGSGGKKRKTIATAAERITESGNEEKSSKKISSTIQPGESIRHFNKSVLAIPSLKFH